MNFIVSNGDFLAICGVNSFPIKLSLPEGWNNRFNYRILQSRKEGLRNN